jgi:hypothetical protein
MELNEAINTFKEIFALSDKQLDFLDKMCYIDKGMWKGDVNELIIAEAKRDLALTLRSYRKLKTEELEKQLIENGDDKWMIQTMTQLT